MSNTALAPIDPAEWVHLAEQVVVDSTVFGGIIAQRRRMPDPVSVDHFLSLREAVDISDGEVAALLAEVGREASRTTWIWTASH